ncbi:nodulation protein NodH [Epibacterium sp. SM1979]|uniref:Nodulation protein NodH n=1 Tax=Tritonibacter litoralis TaxID=2662264 RepID=A0A843YF23_9RHOB|nr:sulfotransferase family 2 domain-containing protein [Tritonibacter litoralis]MQQ08275.1 nodulation protein NodH [Tritonibacter litoralis]
MPADFDYFVIFAEMRTGSNFLESNLNSIEGVTSFGEAFNPHFIGYPNSDDVLGVTLDARENDPMEIISRIKAHQGFGGFRYFHEHDPRVLEPVLDDARCAKIILTRNPLDSYISLKIAKETGQWKLTNVKQRKDALVDFDMAEFTKHLDRLQGFQLRLQEGLQRRGQTPFYVAYEDLQSVGVLNGLAHWLGLPNGIDGLDDKLKRQNPSPALSKVSNPEEMIQALATIDTFNLSRTPCFEPRRGPNVRSYLAAPTCPLLFMPMPGAPRAEVCKWMAALDGAPQPLLEIGGQKDLRQWMNAHPGHRRFTVLRHPLARAHAAFVEVVVHGQSQLSKKLRQSLRQQGHEVQPNLIQKDRENHAAVFSGFLDFLKQNLNGQTSVRVDARWASQSQILSGFEEFCAPDLVLREEDLAEDLPHLARKVTQNSAPTLQFTGEETLRLADIYTRALEDKARAAYRRDYMMFGFRDWVAPNG